MRYLLVIKTLIKLLPVLFLLWFVWSWGFCRFYVGPGEMAIVTAKSGKPLPPGQLLAQPGERGVLADVLGEGRHLRNPIFYDWRIVPAVHIPPGKVGIVTAKFGTELPPDEFLAGDGEKGIRRRVLGPGRYRLNPVGYDVEIVNMVSVPVGFAAVVTSLSGQPTAEGTFARPGQTGIRENILQPGLYYVNPREFRVSVVEVGVNQVSLLGTEGSLVLTKSLVDDNMNPMIQGLNLRLRQEHL